MACYNSELPIGPPGPPGPQGPPGTSGNSSYKVYTALLTQSNSDSPIVATVLENTLGGDVTFLFDEQPGNHDITSDNLFGTANKCVVFIGTNRTAAPIFGGGQFVALSGYNSPSGIKLFILNPIQTEFSNDPVFNLPIEIRVYN